MARTVASARAALTSACVARSASARRLSAHASSSACSVCISLFWSCTCAFKLATVASDCFSRDSVLEWDRCSSVAARSSSSSLASTSWVRASASAARCRASALCWRASRSLICARAASRVASPAASRASRASALAASAAALASAASARACSAIACAALAFASASAARASASRTVRLATSTTKAIAVSARKDVTLRHLWGPRKEVSNSATSAATR
mmetsp:Transcript_2877/g.5415  ORF Transcript_2877/g.5415 Transcript_2877/m.5415 type:complete len:214 (-) Transcript_2877:1351-1992(-)